MDTTAKPATTPKANKHWTEVPLRVQEIHDITRGLINDYGLVKPQGVEWTPELFIIEKGIDTIVINASGCGVMIKDYAEILANDPVYADKAKRISAMAKDVSEILPNFAGEIEALAEQKRAGNIPERVTYHPPCTMQHGQKIRGHVEALLGNLGVTVRLCQDSHLCCGSAGTYSMLQPELSLELRDRKLTNIAKTEPQEIVSGNVGCINHLQSGTDVPVRHWIELVDRMI